MSCGCPEPCPDPLDQTPDTGCLKPISAECVTYLGPTLDCSGIEENQTLEELLSSLNDTICDMKDDIDGHRNFQCSDLNQCSINSLSDVLSLAPEAGQILTWDGENYIPDDPFVWECSYLNSCSIDSLSNVVVDSPSTGDVLMWNGTEFINTALTPSTTYTSSNGITETSDNFKLGGVLIENTTITGGGFDLILGTSGSKLGQLDIWAADINMVSDDIISFNTSDESTQTQGFRYQKDFGSLSIGKTVFDDFSTYEGMYRIGDNITVAKTGILDPLGAYIGAGIMVDSAIGFVIGSDVAVSEFYGFMSGFRLTAEGLIGGIVLGQDIDIAGGGTGNQVAYVIGSNVDVAFSPSIQQGVVVFNPSTVQINSSATGNAVNEKIKVDVLSTVVFNSNDYFFYTDLNNTDGWNVNTDVVRFTKDFIQISQSTGTVPAEKLGCIRYNTATDKYQGFTTATGWTNLH